MKPMYKPPIRIRSVWAYNFFSEFDLINSVLDDHPFVAMDTEFPGIIYDSEKPHYHRSPEERYALLKANVDDLHLIQLGLTLSDADGNLPDLGTGGSVGFAWEFNFCDFDIYRDRYAPESIKLLQSNGIDFGKTRFHGIDSVRFATSFINSRLARPNVKNWVTFHGAYDFGFLVKMITFNKLPNSLEVFVDQLKKIFGERVFDVKQMMRYCNGMYGGLEQVASMLQVDRTVGRCHQAGSDSLLIAQAFRKMKQIYFQNDSEERHAGMLFGL